MSWLILSFIIAAISLLVIIILESIYGILIRNIAGIVIVWSAQNANI